MCLTESHTSPVVQASDYFRGIRDRLLLIRILYLDFINI